jgi:hypothetical protein
MAHVSSVLRFPLIPRITANNRSDAGAHAIRLRLKEIIDTAYDGLLNQIEADALARIDELLRLSAE